MPIAVVSSPARCSISATSATLEAFIVRSSGLAGALAELGDVAGPSRRTALQQRIVAARSMSERRIYLDPRPPLDDRFLDLTDVVRDHTLITWRTSETVRSAAWPDPRRGCAPPRSPGRRCRCAQRRPGPDRGDRVVDLGTACRGRQLDLPDVPGDGALHPLEHLDHCLLRLAPQRCDLVSTRGDRLLDRAAVLGRSMRQSPERLLDADVELLHARVDRLLHVREPGLELREAHPGGLLRLVEALEQLADCAAPVGDDLVDPAGEPGVECSGTLLERSCRRR